MKDIWNIFILTWVIIISQKKKTGDIINSFYQKNGIGPDKIWSKISSLYSGHQFWSTESGTIQAYYYGYLGVNTHVTN